MTDYRPLLITLSEKHKDKQSDYWQVNKDDYEKLLAFQIDGMYWVVLDSLANVMLLGLFVAVGLWAISIVTTLLGYEPFEPMAFDLLFLAGVLGLVYLRSVFLKKRSYFEKLLKVNDEKENGYFVCIKNFNACLKIIKFHSTKRPPQNKINRKI